MGDFHDGPGAGEPKLPGHEGTVGLVFPAEDPSHDVDLDGVPVVVRRRVGATAPRGVVRLYSVENVPDVGCAARVLGRLVEMFRGRERDRRVGRRDWCRERIEVRERAPLGAGEAEGAHVGGRVDAGGDRHAGARWAGEDGAARAVQRWERRAA